MKLEGAPELPKPEKKPSIEEILRDFKPQSNVKFICIDDDECKHLALCPFVPVSTEEIVKYASRKLQMSEEQYHNLSEPEKAEVEKLAAKAPIGGLAITSRSIWELVEIMPELLSCILNKAQIGGKIVFVGNGLSTAPLELLECLNKRKAEIPEIVLVDVFDYSTLLRDLRNLEQQFIHAEHEFPKDLEELLSKCQELSNAIRERQIKAIKYIVGSGNPPEELNNADLIVNCFGPPPHTTKELMQCLKVGGELHITGKPLAEDESILTLGQFSQRRFGLTTIFIRIK